MATSKDAVKIPDKRVKRYFVANDFFLEGVTTAAYQGHDLTIYDKERMLIELLRYKSKLPFDYYKEIILSYRRILPTLNIQKIQDYARKCRSQGLSGCCTHGDFQEQFKPTCFFHCMPSLLVL